MPSHIQVRWEFTERQERGLFILRLCHVQHWVLMFPARLGETAFN